MNFKHMIFSLVMVATVSLSAFTIEPYNEARDKSRIIALVKQNPYTFFVGARKETSAQILEACAQEFEQFLSLPNLNIFVMQDEQDLQGFMVMCKIVRPSLAQVKIKMKEMGQTDEAIAAAMPTIKVFYPELPESSDEMLSKVVGVCVHPKFQKQGLGKQLMRFAENFSKENAALTTIALDVNQDNHDALRFYESLGYERKSSNALLYSHAYEKNLN